MAERKLSQEGIVAGFIINRRREVEVSLDDASLTGDERQKLIWEHLLLVGMYMLNVGKIRGGDIITSIVFQLKNARAGFMKQESEDYVGYPISLKNDALLEEYYKTKEDERIDLLSEFNERINREVLY